MKTTTRILTILLVTGWCIAGKTTIAAPDLKALQTEIAAFLEKWMEKSDFEAAAAYLTGDCVLSEKNHMMQPSGSNTKTNAERYLQALCPEKPQRASFCGYFDHVDCEFALGLLIEARIELLNDYKNDRYMLFPPYPPTGKGGSDAVADFFRSREDISSIRRLNSIHQVVFMVCQLPKVDIVAFLWGCLNGKWRIIAIGSFHRN